MEISLSNSTFGMMKGGTSQNLWSFYFHNCWIYVEIMTQNVNFLIKIMMTSAVPWLPEYPTNVQGHTCCKKGSHSLYYVSVYNITLFIWVQNISERFLLTCMLIQKKQKYIQLLFQHRSKVCTPPPFIQMGFCSSEFMVEIRNIEPICKLKQKVELPLLVRC